MAVRNSAPVPVAVWSRSWSNVRSSRSGTAISEAVKGVHRPAELRGRSPPAARCLAQLILWQLALRHPNLQDTREANKLALRHQNDPQLPEYARESLLLLSALVDYLDDLHSSAGFHEILTPAERGHVAEIVSEILDEHRRGSLRAHTYRARNRRTAKRQTYSLPAAPG